MTVEEMKKKKTELGFSCEQISDRSGVPLGTVQKIFSGITKRPRYDTIVELVNPVADTVSRKTYTGADVDWYVKAEDIVLKNKGNQNAGNPQNHVPQGQMKK